MNITLTDWEFKACVDLANARMAVSNHEGMNHSSTYRRSHLTRLEQETVGACAEMAVSKALGFPWTPSVNTFHHIADVGKEIEVRGTTRIDGSLIVRDNDPDHRFYFLVVGEPPNLEVVGYIQGSKAKQEQWLRNPNGHRESWFVPQNELQKLREEVA